MTTKEELVSIAERLKKIAEGLEASSETEITIEELRGVLAQKSILHKEEVKAILCEHGAKALSELSPTDYGAVLKEVTDIE